MAEVPSTFNLKTGESAPDFSLPDGKGELVMTASNAVTRSIRFAGSKLSGEKNVSFVQNNQRQMKSNVVEKQEEIKNITSGKYFSWLFPVFFAG